jgi:hopanoid C-3 methylase
MALPARPGEAVDPKTLYVHQTKGRPTQALDEATGRFVDATRMGTAP